MTARLIALDLPGGAMFVDSLRRLWHRGDAAFPVDQRLPSAARAVLLREMGASGVIGPDGEEARLDSGRPVEHGDALVVATSGATGEPKGVVLTHAAVEASARATSARLATVASDHWLACLPLSHIGGLAVVARALVTGTALTVLPRFDAAEVTAAAAAGATLVSLVPTTLRRVQPSDFRVIVVGGTAPPSELPPNAVTTYGLTETGSGVVYDGIPLDGVDVRIGHDGEIHLRGPMLLRAYRDGHDPRTEIDGAGGWFATGDIGRWLPDGRLHVEGRRDDMIVSGGENVWPEPVERALRSHPLVGDVAVTGTPDAEWGQVVTAYVVPSGDVAPTLDDLRRTVKETLPGFFAPRLIHVVEEIPRTSIGKPRRAALRR